MNRIEVTKRTPEPPFLCFFLSFFHPHFLETKGKEIGGSVAGAIAEARGAQRTSVTT
jgi:hypothetical protein